LAYWSSYVCCGISNAAGIPTWHSLQSFNVVVVASGSFIDVGDAGLTVNDDDDDDNDDDDDTDSFHC